MKANFKSDLSEGSSNTTPISGQLNPSHFGERSSEIALVFTKDKFFNTNRNAGISVEDRILDKVLNRRTMSHANNHVNTWTKPLFAPIASFVMDSGVLKCRVSDNYETIHCICADQFNLSLFMQKLHKELYNIHTDRSLYFDMFGRTQDVDSLSLPQIFALFATWMSEAFVDKVSGFIIDFVVLLYMAIKLECQTEDVLGYFVTNYIDSCGYPQLQTVQHMMNAWLNPDYLCYMDLEELMDHLVTYFKSVM